MRTIPAPRNALVSFHYYKDTDLDRLAGLRLIGDSGAFSAFTQGSTVTTADVAGWGKQWAHRLAWVAALDVIGDAAATRRNWHEMVDEHGVNGVPTMHFGEPPEVMDYYAGHGVDFMGLGGMVGHKSSKDKLLRWLVAVFRYQRDHHPAMRFHGWGVTSTELLRVPLFSVDSSGWGAGYRYARLTLRDPRTNAPVPVALDGQDVYRPEVARLLNRHYGVKPSDIARSTPATRETLIQVSALAASVNEQWMRRKIGTVSAPSWGHSPAGAGSHMHLADSNASHLATVADMAGPHIHLADSSSKLHRGLGPVADMANRAGPHIHLADTSPLERGLGIVADLTPTREDTQ